MIYLDHAATSYPKPAAVVAAMARWFDEIGVSGERGEGPRTREARAVVQRTRAAIAELVGVPTARVAFVSGATEGLNLALRALCRPGARVLTTPFEHSSVVRPLRALADERHIELEVVGARTDGTPDADPIVAALRAGAADLLVFTHGSNVTGAVLDAALLCEEARRHGVTTLLDASQTAGLLPLDVGADVLVASGHKALHGPPGIGFVAAREGIEMLPQKHGGTGSATALDRHPTDWPQAFEAGTPNTPAIFGLDAALTWLRDEQPSLLLQRSLAAVDRLRDGLRLVSGTRTLGDQTGPRTPVLSFVHERYDPLEMSALLAAAGVHARAGFHCAPWIHDVLGTASAGTLRVSTGPATSDADIDAFLALLADL
ncbi:MAG: aminotransferase class V-fold PLP-dependent enzyme [Planctomycetes bacterium]|nr:aminotransferase class V-fold PLP-dependent enzyme [Planctomycetota bacterium]